MTCRDRVAACRTAGASRLSSWPRVRTAAGLVLAALMATVAMPASAQQPASGDVRLISLSNRADLLSGGDALVEIALPDGIPARGLQVTLGSRDVTAEFAPRPRAGGRVMGVVTGLQLGASTLTARLPDGRGARLVLTNHAIGGPVFAGPQVQPWVCETTASGLAPAKDKACNAPSRTEWFYKPTDPTKRGLQPYDPAAPPSDVAMTTTDQGKTVPFVVRRETGTLDRGIYRTAVLAQPSTTLAPWEPNPGWNSKLYYLLDGNAHPGHRQSTIAREVLDETALSQGFAVASTSLNKNGNNLDTAVSAEAIMMLKEHLVEQLGPIRYTISSGASGGSMHQHVIANAYPGLLDGLVPDMSFPDMFTTADEALDCALLNRHYARTSPHLWAVERQQAAVNGQLSSSTCQLWDSPFNYDAILNDPRVGCLNFELDPMPALPEAPWIYDAVANPSGTRCTLQDHLVAMLGKRPTQSWGPVEKKIGRGFAARPFDNVGVQYGLAALHEGAILPEQFVELNERVGGWDIDGAWQPSRTAADPAAVSAAYRTGLLNDFTHVDVPIIDVRAPVDVELHTIYHSWTTQARIVKAHGEHDNHVIWTYGEIPKALVVMDRWLAAVEKDTSTRPLRQKVAANRPAEAVNSCFVVGEQPSTDEAQCRLRYPYFASPRIASGEPFTEDVQKCRLAPLERTSYDVTFTDEQWQRLQAAFPAGVCDYRRPSVGAQRSVPWLTFEAGPGGRPLPAAPVSIAFRDRAAVPSPTAATLPTTGPSATLALLGLVAAALAVVVRRRAPG